MIKYKVTKLLCPNKKGSYNDYSIFIKLNDKIKANGFINVDIMEGDIIECLLNNINNGIYRIDKNYKVMLPEDPNDQKIRILKLIKNRDDLNTITNNIKYGADFWINIYKWCKDCEDLDGCLIKSFNSLDIIGKHISKYYDSLLSVFTDELKKRNIINIYKNQKIELIMHADFGFYINSWKEYNLYKLYDIKGFAIKTILKIADGINSSIETKTELIILNILNEEQICIKYDYDKWIHFFKDYDISDIVEEKFNKIIENIISKGKIIKIDKYLYSNKMYNYEMNITRTLIYLNSQMNILNQLNINEDYVLNIIKDYEFKKRTNEIIHNEYTLNEEQQKGILSVFKNNVSIIYGKAGTGKSTLITGIIHTIEDIKKTNINTNNIYVFFLTPTAKAKMRIKNIIEETNKENNIKLGKISIIDYQTIHSFIIMLKRKCYEKINLLNDNQFIKLFIIDETSMIDIEILNDFLLLISDYNYCLLFLGDVRQLPSIGPGDFLNKMIMSNCINKTELIKVVRNSGNITNVLDKIINGEELSLSICDDKMVKWIIPKTNNYTEIIKSIINNNDKSIIITSTNNTIEKYTDIIRDIINPNNNKKEIKYRNHIFREGDKVIHTKNFNKKKLINGLSGKIVSIIENITTIKNETTKIIKSDTIIKVKFDEGDLKYFEYNLDEEYIKYLTPAYMITIHKSQGSEYDHVILLITNKSNLTTNLLYTAISRAKKSITLIITEENINYGIKNKENRKTLMKEMFIYYKEKKEDEEFESFYLEHKNRVLSNILEYRGIKYNLEVNTNNVYNQDGLLFGVYNKETNKIKKIVSYELE